MKKFASARLDQGFLCSVVCQRNLHALLAHQHPKDDNRGHDEYQDVGKARGE
jgi:hypothetical protein